MFKNPLGSHDDCADNGNDLASDRSGSIGDKGRHARTSACAEHRFHYRLSLANEMPVHAGWAISTRVL
jgi:hypothetical protein